jgi:site-specific DNA-methyltransferase (adenine-specific)
MFKVNYNPDVLTCLANLSNDEVFTHPKIVNHMLDLLPTEIWSNKETTFLDPCTKSGVFLREIAKRLNVGLEEQILDQEERINHILKNQIFGIAITGLTSSLARRSLYCSKIANGKYSICSEFDNEEGNIIFERIEHTWKNGNCIYCGASQKNYDRDEDLETYAYLFLHTNKPEEFFNMKFDVVVGNPPYQLSDGGASASAIPLYHKFIEQAQKLNPRYLIMITPSRWFSGGKGLDTFRDNMLNDKRIKIIHDFIDASECFPGVEIKGGVNYFLWERDYSGECEVSTHIEGEISSVSKRPLLEEGADVFIRYNEAISIFRKVMSHNEKSFSDIVSSRKPFGLTTAFKGKTKHFTDCIKLYQNNGTAYISKNEVEQNNHWINKHKIFVPYAVGIGDGKKDLIKPIRGKPNSCCSETYLVFGPFESKEELENAISYIKTKFFHFMVTLKKNTQHTTKKAYQFVPIQNFEESWSDEKLFKKYKLSESEINFIKDNIRDMD